MKKTLLLLVAALSLGHMVSAQYYYYTPWTGSKAYSINVGTTLDMKDSTFGFSANHVPLAASVRYDAEKDINESFSWGYQVEVSYLRHGYDYSKPYESYGFSNQTAIGSIDKWNLQLDLRLSLAYYFTDNFEIMAGIGVFYDIISGKNGEQYRVDNLTGAEVSDSREKVKSIDLFSRNFGGSIFLGANYYFNDEFFITCSLRDQMGLDFFKIDEEQTIENRALVLVGVGFKIL